MKLPELLQQKPFVHDTQPHRVPHPAFSTWSESRVGVSSWDQPAHYVLCSGFNTFVLRRTNDDRPKGVNEQRHLQFWSEQRFTFSTCLLSFQSVPVVIYKTHSLHVNGDLNDFIVLHKNLIRSKCTLTFALSSSGLVRCDHSDSCMCLLKQLIWTRRSSVTQHGSISLFLVLIVMHWKQLIVPLTGQRLYWSRSNADVLQLTGLKCVFV